MPTFAQVLPPRLRAAHPQALGMGCSQICEAQLPSLASAFRPHPFLPLLRKEYPMLVTQGICRSQIPGTTRTTRSIEFQSTELFKKKKRRHE